MDKVMEGFLTFLFIALNLIGIGISFVNIYDGSMLGFIIEICQKCNIIGKICITIFFIALFPIAVIGELLIKFFVWLFTVGKKR